MNAVRKMSGGVSLTIVEADQILLALENAKVLRNLTGSQRQQMEDATASLAEARTEAAQGWVILTPTSAANVLRCVSLTQKWLGDMFDEFGDVDNTN